MAAAGVKGSAELFKESLRKAGLRVTRSRLSVLAALSKAGAPATHADLALSLKATGIDRATVFRNLRDLCTAGLVLRSDLGDRTWRYETRNHRHKRAVPTFVCTSCGALEVLEGLRLVREDGKKLPRQLRKRPVVIHVHGVCDRCAKAADDDDD